MTVCVCQRKQARFYVLAIEEGCVVKVHKNVSQSAERQAETKQHVHMS